MSHVELASALCDSVGLLDPPVALAFVGQQPEGVPSVRERAPSSCAFWRAAQKQTFYAAAADHNGCAVGAHVMGFPISDQTGEELMAAVKLMAEVGYLPDNEVANIPRVAEPGAGIVYGPLADFPLEPSAVLVWVNPAQAMVLEEGLKRTTWREADHVGQELFGRPACGAVARAVNSERSAYSLGCAGMRTFTGIPATLSLLVIPRSALPTLAADLRRIVGANRLMLDHYRAKQAAFA